MIVKKKCSEPPRRIGPCASSSFPLQKFLACSAGNIGHTLKKAKTIGKECARRSMGTGPLSKSEGSCHHQRCASGFQYHEN